jgi:hypothetical protein
MKKAVWHVATRRQATLCRGAWPARRFRVCSSSSWLDQHALGSECKGPQLECLNLGRKSDPALADASGVRNFGIRNHGSANARSCNARSCDARSRAAGLAALQRGDTSAINQRTGGNAWSSARRAYARRSSCRAPAGSAPSDRRSRCAGPIFAAQARRPRPGPRRRQRSGRAGR